MFIITKIQKCALAIIIYSLQPIQVVTTSSYLTLYYNNNKNYIRRKSEWNIDNENHEHEHVYESVEEHIDIDALLHYHRSLQDDPENYGPLQDEVESYWGKFLELFQTPISDWTTAHWLLSMCFMFWMLLLYYCYMSIYCESTTTVLNKNIIYICANMPSRKYDFKTCKCLYNNKT